MNVSLTNNIVTISDTLVTEYKYIHIIQLNEVSGPGTQYVVYTHDTSSTTLAKDGYYTLTQIRLPLAIVAGTYYIVEGTSDQIIGPLGTPITLTALLAVDPTGTTIVKTTQNIFEYYLLNNYYLTLLRKKFLNNVCNCSCISSIEKLTLDTLTMGTILIDKLVTNLKYYEAERIVEQLSICSGITTITNCNCNG